MKKRLLIILLFIIFLVSFTTLLLLLKYFDPYQNIVLGISLLILTFLLSMTSFFTIVLYFLKKVYFRGNVFFSHVIISFRQSLLISLYVIGLIIFYNIGTPIYITGFLLMIIFVFLELLLKNIKD